MIRESTYSTDVSERLTPIASAIALIPSAL